MPVLRPTHAAKRAFARQTPCNSIVSAGVMTEKADRSCRTRLLADSRRKNWAANKAEAFIL